MKELDFEPIKSKRQFLTNYEKHDEAIKLLKDYLSHTEFSSKPFGEDRRYEHIWEKGRDKPDCQLFSGQTLIALTDVKGHSGSTFMLNKRAYNSYLRWAQLLKVPCYIIWFILKEGRAYYARLPFSDSREEHMPHNGNDVIITGNKGVFPLINFVEILCRLSQNIPCK